MLKNLHCLFVLLISRNKDQKNVLFIDTKKLDSSVKEALEIENF